MGFSSKHPQDLNKEMQANTLLPQIVYGGASIFSKRFTIDDGIQYLGLSVPAGREIHIAERLLTLPQGIYEVDVLLCDSFTTTSATDMIQSILHKDVDDIQSTFKVGVTSPVNMVLKEEGYVDTGTDKKAASALSIDGVYKTFTGNAVIRINKLGNDGTDIANIIIIAWEVNA
jgi:hypothetical protein